MTPHTAVGRPFTPRLRRGSGPQKGRRGTALIRRLQRNDRIEQNLKIRPAVQRSRNSQSGGQMSAGRRAHNAHVVRIYTPCRRIFPNQPHGFFRITDRNLRMSERQTIFQHDISDSQTVEKRSPVIPLMRQSQMGITASRTSQHRPPRSHGRIGQKNLYLRREYPVRRLFRPMIPAIGIGKSLFPKKNTELRLCVHPYTPESSTAQQAYGQQLPFHHMYCIKMSGYKNKNKIQYAVQKACIYSAKYVFLQNKLQRP